MDKVFLLQVAVSFVIGGSLVAFLSLVAEKVSDNYAGMVLSLPSTVAISFFFFSLIFSPYRIPVIVPSVIVSLGGMLVLIVTYLYLSKLRLRSTASIILCAVGSIIIWTAFSIPIAITKFSNYPFSILIYVAIVSVAYGLIKLGTKKAINGSRLTYSLIQKLIRAIFAGVIIALAVLLSKKAGIFWGGIFSVFPAAFLSTLIIYHWHYDSEFLFQISKKIPIGSLILFSFIISAKYIFPQFDTYVGTGLSYLASIGCLIILVTVQGQRYGR